jgi:hypothetical protein
VVAQKWREDLQVSRHRHRRLITAFPLGGPKDTEICTELWLPHASPPPEAMAGSSVVPAMEGHDGMITSALSPPPSLSLTRLVLDVLDFFRLYHAVVDP